MKKLINKIKEKINSKPKIKKSLKLVKVVLDFLVYGFTIFMIIALLLGCNNKEYYHKVNAPLVMERYNAIESKDNNGVFTYSLTDLINSYNFNNYVEKKQAVFDTLFEPRSSIPSLSTLGVTYYDLYTNDVSGVTAPATFGYAVMTNFDVESGDFTTSSYLVTFNTIVFTPVARTRIGGETPPKTNHYVVDFDVHFLDSDYSTPSSPVVNTDRQIAKIRVERYYIGDTPFYNVAWVEIYNITTPPRFTPGNNLYITEPSGSTLEGLFDHNNYWNSLFLTDYQTFYNNGYNYGYQIGDQNGYERGYQAGYNEGYGISNTQIEGMSFNPFDLLKNAFSSVANIFNIQVIPGLPLGVLIFTPIVITIIVVVVKIFRG